MEDNKEKILDLTKIIPLLLRGWKYYVVSFFVVLAFSLAFVFTIPRYYSCKIMLAPESTDMKGGLGSLMSSFGLGELEASEDAISPMLYPDLMESKDFVYSLFPVNIETKDESIQTTYFDYIKNHTKHSWYMYCIGEIGKALAKKESAATGKKKYSSSFMPSKEENDVAEAIAGKIKYDYDKKTGVISVSVQDQDPLVCALIADTICNRLQTFITDYRTKKARNDLEYSERLYATAKAEYEEANAVYAAAVDDNWDVMNESFKAQIQKLENDRNLKYQTFSAINQKLQTSRAKLQEDTPVITMLQGASVPVKPAGPKRMIITLALLVLAFIASSLVLLAKNGGLK